MIPAVGYVAVFKDGSRRPVIAWSDDGAPMIAEPYGLRKAWWNGGRPDFTVEPAAPADAADAKGSAP